jgi:hypothetical protein
VTEPNGTETVSLFSIGRQEDIELPTGTTYEQAKALMGINPDLEIRVRGRVLSEAEQRSTTVQNGDTVYAEPPAVKHG